MKYKIVFKEEDLIVFDTIEINEDQFKMLQADSSVLSLERILSEPLEEEVSK